MSESEMLGPLYTYDGVSSPWRARLGRTRKELGVYEMSPRLSAAHLVRLFVLTAIGGLS